MVVHDHATPGGPHDSQEIVDAALDHARAHVPLDVRGRSRQIEERRALLDEVRGGDEGERPLDVGREDEALVLPRVDDRQHDDRAERRAVDAVRQRRALTTRATGPSAVQSSVPRLAWRPATIRRGSFSSTVRPAYVVGSERKWSSW